MAQGDHLRPLQMGVAGQERGRVLARAPAQHHTGAVDAGHHLAGRGQGIEPHVRGHLIVATARRVQAAPWVADQFNEPAFDIHMNVFQGRIHGAAAFAEFLRHTVQAGPDRLGVFIRDEAHRGQHAGMGLAATHVVVQQPAVECHAGVQRCGCLVHGRGKPRSTATSLGVGWVGSGRAS